MRESHKNLTKNIHTRVIQNFWYDKQGDWSINVKCTALESFANLTPLVHNKQSVVDIIFFRQLCWQFSCSSFHYGLSLTGKTMQITAGNVIKSFLFPVKINLFKKWLYADTIKKQKPSGNLPLGFVAYVSELYLQKNCDNIVRVCVTVSTESGDM